MTDHNGVWLDVDSGAVGFDKPKRAKLLVSPGRKIPDEVAERMDAKKAPAEVSEPAAEDEPTPAPKRRRAAKKPAAG